MCLLAVLLSTTAMAQNGRSAATKAESRAVIEGVVTKEPGSEPVKKALIELIAENQSEGGDYTAVSGTDGAFRIEGILPGRYHLFVERTGMLEMDKNRSRAEGRILTLIAGQNLKDVRIQVQAAAVVRGRVTDEDGDPVANAQVAVLRQTFVSGRGKLEQAGGDRTNDLGEYRISGLPSGKYYVTVTPAPDLKSLIESAGAGAEPRGRANDRSTALTYQITYYPGTADRGQASPVELHAGDDFPVNFSLTPGPSLNIRGSVVNLPPRTSAAIMLLSQDFNLTMNGAEMHPDGSFVIRDVAPGAYTILATVENAPVPMMARQALQLGTNSVEDLRLSPQPGGWIHGRLRLESKAGGRFDLGQMFLQLRSSDGDGEEAAALSMGDGFSHLAHVGADGSFEWKNVPPGNYYVQLAGEVGANANLFLKAARVGNRDLADTGISVNGGAVSVELVLSDESGTLDGVAVDPKGEPVANAVIVAVPEFSLRGRFERFRKSVSDQSGRFTLRGIQPGEYTVVAWESVEGEAYLNRDFLKLYEGQGKTLRVVEGDRKYLPVEVIPSGEE